MPAGIPLGPYLLVRRLATGGMAEIFLARREGPEGFARDLVVKRVLPHLSEDPAFTDMFLEEARIAARLTHPNVVQVYDFGEADGSYYLAMELVRGVDLRALIERAARQAYVERRSGAIPAHHAAKIMSLVCEGLAHAHDLTADGQRVGLVHRDISPSNVLISFEGAVKVADFGIVKTATGRQRDDTRIGVVKGKYAYMSPEQARGEHLDARSDLFNVGVLLFEAITGDTIFPHGDYRAAKLMSAAGRIPQPERIDQLPSPLARVARRAMAPAAADRYADALELRADLEAFVRGAPEPSDPVEIGRYVRTLFPDVLEEDRRAPRAAGTVPATVVAGGEDPTVLDPLGPTRHAKPRPGAQRDEPTQPIDLGAPPEPAGPVGRRSRRGVLLAVSTLAAAILGVAGYLAFGRADSLPPSEPPSPGPPAHEAPPAPLPGELRVTSEPLGLPLVLDGEPAGTTPTVLSLPSGRVHRLSLRAEDGAEVVEEVTLVPGEERELVLRAPVASLATLRVVTVPPGATVRVSGEERGTTPVSILIEPGEYDVEVGAEGFEAQSARALLGEPTETATLSFVLQEAAPSPADRPRSKRPRPTGTLVIATTPWSEVYLGARRLGTTPLSNVRLPAGRHTLTLRAPGRQPRRHPVVIRRGEETRVRLAW